MALLNEKDVYCQMTILLSSKMVDIKKFTPHVDTIARTDMKTDNRAVNIVFVFITIIIVGLICFSIWLSTQVAKKKGMWIKGTLHTYFSLSKV